MVYGEPGTDIHGNPTQAGPHALTSIKGNPSMIPDEFQKINYNHFGKVADITEGSKKLELTYGFDEQRRIGKYFENGSQDPYLTRYYLGNYEEETDASGNSRKLHYISGGNGLAAIYVIENGTGTMYYTHTDYLGSLTVLSDQNGNPEERYAFDPWGKRRNPTDWTLADNRTSLKINRGYTMHEHLDDFNLINMNGRVYDPLVARFLSPDPFIQAPDVPMNYNRYAYCYNNPFLYTDPDGNFAWSWFAAALGQTLFNWGGSVADNVINHEMSFGDAIKNSTVSFGSYYGGGQFSNPSFDMYQNIQGENRISNNYDTWLNDLRFSHSLEMPSLFDFEYPSMIGMPGGNGGIQRDGGFITIPDGSFPIPANVISLPAKENRFILGPTIPYNKTKNALTSMDALAIAVSLEDHYNNLKDITKKLGFSSTSKATRFARGARFLRWGGVAGSAYLTFTSANRIFTGVGNGWDKADFAVGTLGLIATGVAMTNPVGWVAVGVTVVGYGVTTYSTTRIVMDLYNKDW